MVVVLDKNATPFTRIWCGFEQATVVQLEETVLGKKLLLDFATVHEGKAQLLTEGVAAADEKSKPPWSDQGFHHCKAAGDLKCASLVWNPMFKLDSSITYILKFHNCIYIEQYFAVCILK